MFRQGLRDKRLFEISEFEIPKVNCKDKTNIAYEISDAKTKKNRKRGSAIGREEPKLKERNRNRKRGVTIGREEPQLDERNRPGMASNKTFVGLKPLLARLGLFLSP